MAALVRLSPLPGLALLHSRGALSEVPMNWIDLLGLGVLGLMGLAVVMTFIGLVCLAFDKNSE